MARLPIPENGLKFVVHTLTTLTTLPYLGKHTGHFSILGNLVKYIRL